jgi:hypothetical protein
MSISRPAQTLLLTALLLAALTGCESEPQVPGFEPSMRMLTEAQYRNVIRDLFGAHIVVASNFNPISRSDGLIAIGAANSTVSASSFAKYEKLAHAIATQVLNEANHASYVPCEPPAGAVTDDACARDFLGPVGRALFRRPLSDPELEQTVDLASAAAQELDDFHDGLAMALASLLVSPNFLFIIDELEPGDPATDGEAVQLTAYAKAARLSFFLWNTAPDSQLLDAAAAGELDTQGGLEAQVTRMMQSARLREGVRAFFTDMLHLQELEHLVKDNLIYPAFDPAVRDDAREQLLRTVAHHLLDGEGDYRDLFSSGTAFMNGPLGRIYRVPVPEPDLWTMHNFADHDGRAGIHTLAAFVALHSHPGRSSPTIRGKAVREILLCQKIPEPPGDVDFTQFDSTREEKTARERLAIHNSVAACAGCHKLTDGIGLALENFDGAGQYRTRDAGFQIDAGGELDGVQFTDQAEFAAALRDNPGIPSCLVERVLAYSVAHAPGADEKPWLKFLDAEFADTGYRLRPLLRLIATSSNFFAVTAPQDPGHAESESGLANLQEG